MSNPSELTPQVPQDGSPPARTHCPSCTRKLLTQTSALCNWCGAKIDDPDYQQRAAATRQAQDDAERAQVESLAQEEAQFGVLGRLRRRAKLNPGSRNSPLS